MDSSNISNLLHHEPTIIPLVSPHPIHTCIGARTSARAIRQPSARSKWASERGPEAQPFSHCRATSSDPSPAERQRARTRNVCHTLAVLQNMRSVSLLC